MENAERLEALDQSEIDFVRRAILIARGNPHDPGTWEYWECAYLKLRARLRFVRSEPASQLRQ